jgi:hypothetical protein
LAEELGKDPKYKDLVIGTYEGTLNSVVHTARAKKFPSVVLYTAQEKQQGIGMDKHGKDKWGKNGWSGREFYDVTDHTPENMKAFLN